MATFRWNIFLANLDPVVGSEQGKTRPVLVISEERVNQLLSVTNVLPVTSMKPGRKIYPNEVMLLASDSGLPKDSIVLCYQIKTLDKKRFIKKIGQISDSDLKEEIYDALSFQLGIN